MSVAPPPYVLPSLPEGMFWELNLTPNADCVELLLFSSNYEKPLLAVDIDVMCGALASKIQCEARILLEKVEILGDASKLIGLPMDDIVLEVLYDHVKGQR